MKAKKLMEEYAKLGHSKQHQENVETTMAFLDVLNGKTSLSEDIDVMTQEHFKDIEKAINQFYERIKSDNGIDDKNKKMIYSSLNKMYVEIRKMRKVINV